MRRDGTRGSTQVCKRATAPCVPWPCPATQALQPGLVPTHPPTHLGRPQGTERRGVVPDVASLPKLHPGAHQARLGAAPQHLAVKGCAAGRWELRAPQLSFAGVAEQQARLGMGKDCNCRTQLWWRSARSAATLLSSSGAALACDDVGHTQRLHAPGPVVCQVKVSSVAKGDKEVRQGVQAGQRGRLRWRQGRHRGQLLLLQLAPRVSSVVCWNLRFCISCAAPSCFGAAMTAAVGNDSQRHPAEQGSQLTVALAGVPNAARTET